MYGIAYLSRNPHKSQGPIRPDSICLHLTIYSTRLKGDALRGSDELPRSPFPDPNDDIVKKERKRKREDNSQKEYTKKLNEVTALAAESRKCETRMPTATGFPHHIRVSTNDKFDETRLQNTYYYYFRLL